MVARLPVEQIEWVRSPLDPPVSLVLVNSLALWYAIDPFSDSKPYLEMATRH